MTTCKYCKSQDLKIVCKDNLCIQYKCKGCKKVLRDNEVIHYITFCPYCKEYLASNAGYKVCMYCGKKLNKKFTKVRMK